MVRYLRAGDCDDYIKLIGQLTNIGNISQSQYNEFVKNQDHNHNTIVYEFEGKVIGCLTMLIEQKIAHSFSCVMHIEDVVVDEKYRGKGLSRVLIERALEVSRERNCYKVILDCDSKNINFYKHMGFSQDEFQMCFRHRVP
jgi:glucosamine-phosphate N-acetyltransferase